MRLTFSHPAVSSPGLSAAGAQAREAARAGRRPRVLLLTDSDSFNGTERHMLDLAAGLRALGEDVRIGCPESGMLARHAGADGFEVVGIEKRGLFDRRAIGILARLLRGGDVDVIHAHNGRTAVLAGFAALWAGRGACVATQHFIEPARAGRRGASAIVSRMVHLVAGRKIARVIAVSEAARRGIIERREKSPEKVRVIPNGIREPDVSRLTPPQQLREALSVPPDASLIVCVARLEAEKDIASLVRAVRLAAEQAPRCVCLAAGDGSERARLEALIEAEGVGSRVRLLGYRSDALSLINASEALVLPSLSEPFGLVLLEAMALGRPVIATNAGGPVEIVVDGVTGLLAEPANPSSLANSLIKIVRDPEAAMEMGRRGRARYRDRFTAEAMARATFEVYVDAAAM